MQSQTLFNGHLKFRSLKQWSAFAWKQGYYFRNDVHKVLFSSKEPYNFVVGSFENGRGWCLSRAEANAIANKLQERYNGI